MVAFHLTPRLAHPHGLLQVFVNHGYLAVSFFFILSGFILTRTYAERWTASSFPPFLLARFARIYPLYLLALLLQLPFYAPDFAQKAHQTVAVLLMVQSWTTLPSSLPAAWNYPAWTLSVEWFFYLIFPLLLAILARIRARRLAIGVTMLVALAIDGPQSAIGRTSWLCHHIPLPLLRVPEFFLGMLVATLPAARTPLRTRRYAIAIGLGTLLLLSLNLHRFVILAIVPFAASIWFLAHAASRIRTWLDAAPLVLLGQASYAVYLLQDPIRNWVALGSSRWPALQAWQSPLYAVLLLLASLLAFAAVEQPARKWIRSLARA